MTFRLPTRKPKGPKPAARDLRQEFIAAGLAVGYSQAQLSFLWDATERRPRPTSTLEREDWIGLVGFSVLLVGFAGWHWQLACILAGAVVMGFAWMSAKPIVPASQPPQ